MGVCRYRGFELLADAGTATLPVQMVPAGDAGTREAGAPGELEAGGTGEDHGLTVMATVAGANADGRAAATGAVALSSLRVYLSNFAPDDGKGETQAEGRGGPADHAGPGTAGSGQGDECAPARWLNRTTFSGNDIYPESKRFKTDTAALCCEACRNYQPDLFCGGWTW